MPKKFKALIKGGIKTGFAYRFHYFTALFLAPISLIIYFFLWGSIFAYSGEVIIRGFTLQQMISYFAISMVVGFFTWSGIDEWLEHDVRHGHLIVALLKPIHFFNWNYFFEFGMNILSVIIEMIPVITIAVIFFGLTIAAPVNLIFFAISVFFASIIYTSISFCVGLTAFWFKRISGIRRMKRILMSFLSGGILPLTFFPENYQRISKFLPFQYARFEPINIYMGKYTVLQMSQIILFQIIWVVILLGLGLLVWNKAFKKFAGAGT